MLTYRGVVSTDLEWDEGAQEWVGSFVVGNAMGVYTADERGHVETAFQETVDDVLRWVEEEEPCSK